MVYRGYGVLGALEWDIGIIWGYYLGSGLLPQLACLSVVYGGDV